MAFSTPSNSDSVSNKSPSRSKTERLDYWSRTIEAWKQSGLTQSAFCRQENIIFHQFVYWRAKSVKMPMVSAEEVKRTAFVPVTLEAKKATSLEVSLPNGIVICGIDEGNINIAQELIHLL